MKTSTPLIAILLSCAALASSALAQKSVEKAVALRDTADKSPLYARTTPGGGVSFSIRVITERSVFTLIDLNGGDLAEGDEVQIKYTSADGGALSYWTEKEGIVRRDSHASNFKVKKSDKGISLQAPTGMFLSAEKQSDHIALTDSPEKALVMEIIDNPTVETIQPKATESPAQSGNTKE